MNKSQLPLCLGLMIYCAALQSEELRIGITDYCPVACMPSGEAPHGLAVSVLQRAFTSPSYILTFVSLPFQRSRSQMKSGKLTAVISDKLGGDDVLWPLQYRIRTNACTYTSIDSTWTYDPENIQNLSQVKYGLIRFYDNSKVEDQQPDNIVYLVPGIESAEYRMLKMIASHRLDTGFLSQISADYLIKHHGLSSIKESGCGTKVYEDTIVLNALHPKAALYQQKIDAAYSELLDSGEYLTLMKSYGVRQSIIDLNLPQ